jgi:glycosyltransferase involved in cell wall biosynthesis
VHQFGADVVFTPAGTATPGLRVPQVVFAQNPWSLVSGIVRTPPQRLKAGLQRRAYREAMKTARVMVFNSRYMRRAYRENAGRRERESVIVYQGIDEKTRRAAESARNVISRKRFQMLCVSAMAPHKNAETLVEAAALVRDRHRVPATVVFVGAWPDAAYAARIRALVQRRGLGGRVTFAGHVSKAELHRRYAESRVFCLLSRCESFGIPAVEAQAFGTPVVGGRCCAVPEVCGKGGVYPPPGDAAAAARCLAELLTDDDRWRRLSDAARRNANRFRWSDCSRPLVEIFNTIGG